MTDGHTLGAQAGDQRLIVQIAAAINARALYAPGHPLLVQAVQGVIQTVVAVCDDRKQESITFLLLEDELVVDQRSLRKRSLYQRPLINALKRRGIQRLTLGRGLETSECQAFIEALAVGGVPRATANVVVGQVKIAFSEGASSSPVGGTGGPAGSADGRGGGDTGERPERFSRALVDAAMDAFLRFRTERRASLGRLDELVWGCIGALSRSTRTILPLAPLKDHDEYTFVHSVNVALLVLAHARSFGIQGELLHSIGLAALLHDVGKLSVPHAILNKPGRLEDEEWKVMMTHAERGASHLCGLETSAPIAIVVAYEHHLRFDGQQNYPVLKTPRPPTLASQMTALADVYDAICTTRPYKKAQSQGFALDVLRSRAGAFHDPFLVGDFCRLLGAG